VTDSRAVARAIDALRRGWPVTIGGQDVLAVETADAADLAAFDAPQRADLLISGNRAATLKLANQREGVPTGPVLIERASWIGLDEAMAVADPALDMSAPMKGPFRTLLATEEAQAALRLARLSGLLPAVFIRQTSGDAAASVDSSDVMTSDFHPTLTMAARAKLPNAAAEQAEIIAFRSAEDAAEHVALLFGAPNGGPPLVRLHSECLTGDVLGSLKCDCGPQLHDALAAIAASGWGMLLYLRQEGRGIGLINKLRAYALQDQGFDTVDANHRLGFADDERDFGIAAEMLRLLKQDKVRLLTNNPRKVEALAKAGIEVTERVPLQTGRNPHNEAYLGTKRDRSGHQLE
jgi:GTP cyclohydrolase II